MEIASLFTSIKVAYDIAKGINSLKSEVERNESISKILEILLSVQSDALLMQEKHLFLLRDKDNLEKKIMEIEKWSETETQYELKEVARGFFVYAYKKSDDSMKPIHWLCANCYKDRKASIIQLISGNMMKKRYLCPNCETEIET
jgi:hypothetical protein